MKSQNAFNFVLLNMVENVEPVLFMLCLEDYFGIKAGQA